VCGLLPSSIQGFLYATLHDGIQINNKREMKYNININQKALMKVAPDINIKSACLLDYLQWLCNSMNEKIAAKRVDGFTWINYNELISQMPILGLTNKSTVGRHIQKLEDAGFIETVNKKMANGNYAKYVKLTAKVDLLTVDSNATPPLTQMQHPVDSNATDNNTNNNINNNNTLVHSEMHDEHEKVFESFWDVYPVKKGKKPARLKFITLMKKTAKTKRDDLLESMSKGLYENIQEYKKDKGEDYTFFPHAQTWINQERWNDYAE
jgi:hypothetical protein